jgi:cytochrome c556
VATTGDQRLLLDVIFARNVLMDQIDLFMSEIEAFVGDAVRQNAVASVEAAEAADNISVMLEAFPHLFPPGSDIWSEQLEAEDPTKVTMALPKLWEEYDDFYALAQLANQQALDLSRLYPRDARFTEAAAELRQTCSNCHQQYTRFANR